MKNFHVKLAIIFVLLSYSILCQAIDTIKVNEKDGLFTATNKSLPIITTSYIGWGENWSWANSNIKSTHFTEEGLYKKTLFRGQVPNLEIKFEGSVGLNQGHLIWNYDWKKSSAFPNAKGFGIEFKITSLNFPSLPSPELLPNNSGWRWKTSENKTIEVIFSPTPDKVFFERGQKNIIRVLFFSGITPGSTSSKMVVKVNDNVKFSGPDSIAYKTSGSLWHKDILSPLSSPVNLSFLNTSDIPAGKRGFILRKKDQLFFEDGSPAKFWGANIQAYALFKTSDFDIKRHAKRIAQLGFNLIRIHHHDSDWVEPNIFKDPDKNTLELSTSALKKIDWWVKCLKDEGVYLWLDFDVGRTFTKNDGVKGFSDFSKGSKYGNSKGFNYYNKDVQGLMKAFNKAYLTHINPYTQLAYKDDPAVIAMLITNENDLTQHFGNLLLADKNVPYHHALFTKDVQKFAKTSGLSEHKIVRTWEMGESKIYLNDAEHRFNQQMIAQLDGLGVKSLVATTNSWGDMGIFGLPSLTDGSIIDAHSYGKAEEIKYNPRYNPGFLTWIGGAQITGYPLSVTEWNVEPFPSKDRFTVPLFTASIASLQGWDAMMLYGYSQDTLGGKGKGRNYSSYNDPAVMGIMPAAAILYRQNHVSPANNSYELKLNRKKFFFTRQDPSTSKTIRTLLETSRLTIGMPDTQELPWLKENTVLDNNSIVIHDANRDFIPAGQNHVESDTGELKRDWKKGIHTINTEKSQVASGWIGGETIDLADVTFKIETGNAVVAVQSLEQKSIRESNKIFITVMARSEPEKGIELPFISEPVTGQLEIHAPKDLKLYPINNLGKLDDNILVHRDSEGKYRVNLSSDMKYHWFLFQSDTPTFEISSFTEAAVYTEGDLILLRTNVSQQDGKIGKVEYWCDNLQLNADTNIPYEQATRELTPGEHVIRSRVTFKDGRYLEAKSNLTIKESPFRITYPYNGDKIIEGQPIVIKTNALKWSNKVKELVVFRDDWKYLVGHKPASYEHSIHDLSVGEHIIRARIIFNDGTRSDAKIAVTIIKRGNKN